MCVKGGLDWYANSILQVLLVMHIIVRDSLLSLLLLLLLLVKAHEC